MLSRCHLEGGIVISTGASRHWSTAAARTHFPTALRAGHAHGLVRPVDAVLLPFGDLPGVGLEGDPGHTGVQHRLTGVMKRPLGLTIRTAAVALLFVTVRSQPSKGTATATAFIF